MTWPQVLELKREDYKIPTRKQQANILLVDDDPNALRLYEKFLSFDNHRVLTTTNPQECLELYLKEKPDIIITDLVMPEMSGLELLQKIREKDLNTEVIVLTGHGDIKAVIQAIQNQASDFLQKPVDFQLLKFAVNRAIERLGLKREVQDRSRKLEALLRQVDYSRHYLQTIVQNSPNALLTYDLDGTIITWNEAAERITGYKEEEAIGHSLEDIFMLEGPIITQDSLEEGIGEQKNIIAQILTKKNELRYIHRNASVIRDEKNRVVGGIEGFLDVTEQIKNDRLLEKRYLQVQTINEISKQIARSQDLEAVGDFVVKALVKSFFESSQVTLFIYDPAKDRLVLRAMAGYQTEKAQKRFPLGSEFRADRGVLGAAFTERTPQIIHDVKQSGLFIDGIIEGVKSEFAWPFKAKNRVVGVLNIENTERIQLDESDRFMLEAIVEFLGISAERIEMLNHIKGQNKLLEQRAEELHNALGQVESQKMIIEEQNQRLLKDLKKAGDFQQSLLPEHLPQIEEVGFSAIYIPSSQLGGDYYDIFRIDDRNIGILLADASGHGVAAAMMTAMFKMTFQKYVTDVLSPAEVFAKLNTDFCKVFQMGEFFTAFYAVYDRMEKKLTYANAAHPKPILALKNKTELQELDTNGFLLGVMDMGIEYEQKELYLNEPARLMIFTDGVNEAANAKGKQYGIDRVKKQMVKNLHRTKDEFMNRLQKALYRFTKAETFEDDVSIIVADFH